jgi:hypothetical protein
MVRIVLHTVSSLILILVEPLCNLLERPTLFTELKNLIVKELLVFRIGRRKGESC